MFNDSPRRYDTLSGKPFYVYNLNLTSDPVSLPTFMVAGNAMSAPPCIIHFRVEKPYLLKNESLMSMQCDHGSTDPTGNSSCYKLHVHATREWIPRTPIDN